MKSFLTLVAFLAALGQQPARDASGRVTTTGTASITGTVVSDDGPAQPIRRANVVLVSSDGAPRRSETTDDNGVFAFRDLTAGRYALSASKSAWLTTNYGASRPGRSGTAIAVADDARLTAVTLRMARGAVVTGIVRDMYGQPAPGVRVRVSKLVTRNGERRIDSAAGDAGGFVDTDDTGTYRLYGLPPGDVIVSAVVQSTMVNQRGDIGAFRRMTLEEFNRANELVRTGRGEMTAPGPPVKPAMVFYPGTTDPDNATALTLAAGDERTGIDLTMTLVPTSTIEGVVTDANGTPVPRSSVLVISGGLQLGGLMGLNGVTSTTTDNDGRYRLLGLGPGEYSLMTGDDKAWAETKVVVSGQDLNVPLTVRPLLLISGRVVFEGTTPPENTVGLRYSVVATGAFASFIALATSGSVIGSGSGSGSGPERTFSANIVPGKYQLQFTGVPAGWHPKSAIARGQDTFDAPVEIGPGDPFTQFVVTFTDRPSELTGSLVDTKGRPAPEYFVVVFSTDQRYWTQPSRRVVHVRPASDGTFSVKALPAGEYFIAALTDIEPGEPLTADVLGSIVLAAPPERLKILDGQRTVLPLKVGG